MKEDRYAHVDEMMEVFQQFSKMNWQKITLFGLKPSEIRVLITIRLGNKKADKQVLTVSEISKRLKVTSPTITQMVNSLLSQGLVVRTSDSQDRRVSGIQLTGKGELLADKAVSKIRDTFAGMADYLGQEQSDMLVTLLNKVHAYFEQIQNNPEL